MADEEVASNDIRKPNFTLYVTNIPSDLEKDGVQSIFLEYGDVTGVILIKGKNNTNQAYISYSNYSSAEAAINELDNKLPLLLRIRFKDKYLKKSPMTKNINLSSPIDDFRGREDILNDTKSVDLVRSNCSPSLHSKAYTHEDDLLYPVPSNLVQFNPYEPIDPFYNTNLMYTRGTVQLSKDGRRHISSGRGTIFYELPDPHCKIATYVQCVHEKREKGYYKYAPEPFENEVNNCNVCSTPTLYYCEKCSVTFYCSPSCQMEDWPKHKFECQSMPSLVKKPNSTITRRNIGEPKIFKEEADQQPKETVHPEGKKKKPSNRMKTNLENVARRWSNMEEINDEKSINFTKDESTEYSKPSPTRNKTNNDLVSQMKNCSVKSNSSSAKETIEFFKSDDALTKLEKFPSIIDNVSVGESGLILIHAILSQREYNITLVPERYFQDFSSLLENMKEHCLEKLANNPDFRPEVGDLICGETAEANEWFRGIVLSTKPLIKLAVIDESRVFVPINCTTISQQYGDINSLGLVCQFPNDGKMPNEIPDSGKFIVTKISKDAVTVEIIFEEIDLSVKDVILKKWIPKLEQKSLECVPLKSGDTVKMVHFSSQNLIYVQNLEEEHLETTSRLEQNIAKYALNKKSFSNIPVIGKIVMAHYKADNNYYRAVITSTKNERVLVKYIDYGNEEIIDLSRIFVLPDFLKEHPACVTKITLKGIRSDIPLTQNVTKLFQELIGKSVKLICTFDKHPFEDGVVLTTLQNENINSKMNKLITPSWEQDSKNKDNIIFSLSDLPTLKLGNVGDTVEAVVIFYSDNNLFLGPNDDVAAKAIQVEMVDNIADYVAKTKEHYIPRESELCIAKNKDKFYRGLCLRSSASPTKSLVFFIDYGQIACVEHTDIRVFAEDFANIGAFSTLCTMTPTMLPSGELADKAYQRIVEFFSESDRIVIKIIKEDTDGTLEIDVPALRQQLTAEDLI